ncbi:DUF3261 domain-containing protein [Zooshikella ganghwensis]|uniref:DUF3261 domain-containing protein n=1 Tax=Zooshikella ganghwensis TaxID=202772 RepID=A0A4P9VRK1_9GAMM|nr:DUF3261 domain-containing protein [Zooshikella ganghwensis]RDH45676.1 DUF3261 domain-containing protein [Zooshikella ganghwensis]
MPVMNVYLLGKLMAQLKMYFFQIKNAVNDNVLNARLLLLICCCFLCAGCNHWSERSEVNRLSNNNDSSKEFTPTLLPGLTWIKKPFVLTQNISVLFKDKQLSLLTQTEVTPKRITIVGLSHLGQHLFTVSYNGKDIEKKYYLPEEPVDLNYIMQDFLWVYAPLSVLQQRLQVKGYLIRDEIVASQQSNQLSEVNESSALKKRFINSQQQQTVISYRQRRPNQWDVQLKSSVRHYEVQIITVEQQQL